MKALSFALVVLLALQLSHARSTLRSALSCAIGRHKKGQPLMRFFYDNSAKKNDNVNKFDADNVTFTLHTNQCNQAGETLIVGDEEVLKRSSFNKNNPTRIVTHGYASSSLESPCVLPKNAFLMKGDYNVILVDWWNVQKHEDSGLPQDYFEVAEFVKEVGQKVASMIDFLTKHGMKLENTTLVGHSLGAHVMGIAGNITAGTVNYIVGLDPALPAFEDKDRHERLSDDDATRVEVIHTNVEQCGMREPIGHYDFYPNGGARQPGCETNSCSHSRAPELYAESILADEDGFYGRRCTDFDSVTSYKCYGDVVLMGGHKKDEKTPEGVYYVETNGSPPYALGQSKCFR